MHLKVLSFVNFSIPQPIKKRRASFNISCSQQAIMPYIEVNSLIQATGNNSSEGAALYFICFRFCSRNYFLFRIFSTRLSEIVI